MLPKLNDFLFREWNKLFPGVPEPRSVNYLGVTGSIEGGTTTFMGFIEKEASPAFAVKIHRYPDAEDRVIDESEVLNFLQENGGILASSVPKLIAFKQISGVWMLVQTIIEGRPLMAEMDKNGLPEIGCAVKNIDLSIYWLTKLHSIIQPDSSMVACRLLKQKGLKNIESCLRLFDLSGTEQKYLERTAQGLDRAVRSGAFIQHGDFCRHNILLSGNRGKMKVGIIDWSDSKRSGFPLHDIFFFLATYYLQIRKHTGIKGFIQAFEDTYLSQNQYSNEVRRTLVNYCSQLNMNLSDIKVLFGIFLLNQALFEYKKIIRCLGSGGLPRLSIYLGMSTNKGYPEVLKEQLWIYFFRSFVKNQDRFIVTS